MECAMLAPRAEVSMFPWNEAESVPLASVTFTRCRGLTSPSIENHAYQTLVSCDRGRGPWCDYDRAGSGTGPGLAAGSADRACTRAHVEVRHDIPGAAGAVRRTGACRRDFECRRHRRVRALAYVSRRCAPE